MTDVFRYPSTPCPYCGYRTDAASAVGGSGRAPSDGALHLCMACGQVGIFTFGGRGVRAATEAEKSAAFEDPEVVRLWQRIQQMRVLRRDWPKGTR